MAAMLRAGPQAGRRFLQDDLIQVVWCQPRRGLHGSTPGHLAVLLHGGRRPNTAFVFSLTTTFNF